MGTGGEAFLLRGDDAARVLHGLQARVQHPEAGQRGGGQQRGPARRGDIPIAAAEQGAEASIEHEQAVMEEEAA